MRNIIYPEEYFTIIINAINRGLTKKSAKQLGIGGQIHHIIPKCVAPELEKEKSNMVFLTYEEHYTVHKILAEANQNDSIAYAWCAMSTNKETKQFFTSEDYARAMEISCKQKSEKMSGDKNPAKREDVKKIISEKMTGDNNPKGMLNKHHSKESREAISKNNKGKKKAENAGRQPLSLFTLEYPDIVFNSYHEATNKAKLLGWIGVSVAGISNIFNAGRKSCGKDEKGNKLHWALVQ